MTVCLEVEKVGKTECFPLATPFSPLPSGLLPIPCFINTVSSFLSEYSWSRLCPDSLPVRTRKLQGLTVCTQSIVGASEAGHTDSLGAQHC